MQFYKKGIVAGILSFMAFITSFTLLFGTVMTLADMSDEIVHIAGTLILSTGCFMASYVSTQIVRKNGLLQSLMISGMVSAFLLIICIISNKAITVACFEKILCCALLSIIGGIKGINTKKTDEKRFR